MFSLVRLFHWPRQSPTVFSPGVTMLPFFILAFSSVALVRFAVSQWRAIWITPANQAHSDSLQLTAGIDAAAIGAQDFGPLLNLCDRLSPYLRNTSPWLVEVSMYYLLVAVLDQTCRAKL